MKGFILEIDYGDGDCDNIVVIYNKPCQTDRSKQRLKTLTDRCHAGKIEVRLKFKGWDMLNLKSMRLLGFRNLDPQLL